MKTILWERKDTFSVEYFRLVAQGDGFILAGMVVLMLDQVPTHISYSVECDKGWRTRSVVIDQDRSGEHQHLSLNVNDGQTWYMDQSVITFATGLYDVDLEITPATNTLPIRRLNLQVGHSEEVNAVWIRFPSLTLERLQQRYTRIGQGLFQYESSTGYKAQLEVDELGLVTRYDDVWQQVSPGNR